MFYIFQFSINSNVLVMVFKAVRLELSKTTVIVDAETQSKTIAIMAEGKDTEKNALLFEKAPEMLQILTNIKDQLNSEDKWSVEQLIKQATEL